MAATTAKKPNTKGLRVTEVKNAHAPHMFHVENENGYRYVVRIQKSGRGFAFYCQCADHAYRSAPGKPRLCRHILKVLARKSMEAVRTRVSL